jgi:hypothetical protein
LIPKGLRVVPVKVDNVSGGPGLIMPGDRVDVLVHLLRNAAQDVQETTTRTILQNIKVFAVNDVVDVEREKDSKDKEKMTAKTISLLVTPAQGATLTLASEMGKVRLVMRSPDDDSTSVDGISKPSDLLGGSKIANPENERLDKDTAAPPVAKNNGLTDFLNKMKQHVPVPAKAAVPSVTNDTWTIRFLQPNGIIEAVLEAEGGPQAEKMPQGSWRLISTSLTSVSGGGSSAKKQSPSVPETSAPPAPQDGLPPAEPAAESNAKPNPTPQTEQPVEKTPAAEPGAGSPDDTNPMIRG